MDKTQPVFSSCVDEDVNRNLFEIEALANSAAAVQATLSVEMDRSNLPTLPPNMYPQQYPQIASSMVNGGFSPVGSNHAGQPNYQGHVQNTRGVVWLQGSNAGSTAQSSVGNVQVPPSAVSPGHGQGSFVAASSSLNVNGLSVRPACPPLYSTQQYATPVSMPSVSSVQSNSPHLAALMRQAHVSYTATSNGGFVHLQPQNQVSRFQQPQQSPQASSYVYGRNVMRVPVPNVSPLGNHQFAQQHQQPHQFQGVPLQSNQMAVSNGPPTLGRSPVTSVANSLHFGQQGPRCPSTVTAVQVMSNSASRTIQPQQSPTSGQFTRHPNGAISSVFRVDQPTVELPQQSPEDMDMERVRCNMERVHSALVNLAANETSSGPTETSPQAVPQNASVQSNATPDSGQQETRRDSQQRPAIRVRNMQDLLADPSSQFVYNHISAAPFPTSTPQPPRPHHHMQQQRPSFPRFGMTAVRPPNALPPGPPRALQPLTSTLVAQQVARRATGFQTRPRLPNPQQVVTRQPVAKVEGQMSSCRFAIPTVAAPAPSIGAPNLVPVRPPISNASPSMVPSVAATAAPGAVQLQSSPRRPKPLMKLPKCTICSNPFLGAAELRRHVKSRHSDVIKTDEQVEALILKAMNPSLARSATPGSTVRTQASPSLPPRQQPEASLPCPDEKSPERQSPPATRSIGNVSISSIHKLPFGGRVGSSIEIRRRPVPEPTHQPSTSSSSSSSSSTLGSSSVQSWKEKLLSSKSSIVLTKRSVPVEAVRNIGNVSIIRTTSRPSERSAEHDNRLSEAGTEPNLADVARTPEKGGSVISVPAAPLAPVQEGSPHNASVSSKSKDNTCEESAPAVGCKAENEASGQDAVPTEEAGENEAAPDEEAMQQVEGDNDAEEWLEEEAAEYQPEELEQEDEGYAEEPQQEVGSKDQDLKQGIDASIEGMDEPDGGESETGHEARAPSAIEVVQREQAAVSAREDPQCYPNPSNVAVIKTRTIDQSNARSRDSEDQMSGEGSVPSNDRVEENVLPSGTPPCISAASVSPRMIPPPPPLERYIPSGPFQPHRPSPSPPVSTEPVASTSAVAATQSFELKASWKHAMKKLPMSPKSVQGKKLKKKSTSTRPNESVPLGYRVRKRKRRMKSNSGEPQQKRSRPGKSAQQPAAVVAESVQPAELPDEEIREAVKSRTLVLPDGRYELTDDKGEKFIYDFDPLLLESAQVEALEDELMADVGEKDDDFEPSESSASEDEHDQMSSHVEDSSSESSGHSSPSGSARARPRRRRRLPARLGGGSWEVAAGAADESDGTSNSSDGNLRLKLRRPRNKLKLRISSERSSESASRRVWRRIRTRVESTSDENEAENGEGNRNVGPLSQFCSNGHRDFDYDAFMKAYPFECRTCYTFFKTSGELDRHKDSLCEEYRQKLLNSVIEVESMPKELSDESGLESDGEMRQNRIKRRRIFDSEDEDESDARDEGECTSPPSDHQADVTEDLPSGDDQEMPLDDESADSNNETVEKNEEKEQHGPTLAAETEEMEVNEPQNEPASPEAPGSNSPVAEQAEECEETATEPESHEIDAVTEPMDLDVPQAVETESTNETDASSGPNDASEPPSSLETAEDVAINRKPVTDESPERPNSANDSSGLSDHGWEEVDAVVCSRPPSENQHEARPSVDTSPSMNWEVVDEAEENHLPMEPEEIPDQTTEPEAGCPPSNLSIDVSVTGSTDEQQEEQASEQAGEEQKKPDEEDEEAEVSLNTAGSSTSEAEERAPEDSHDEPQQNEEGTPKKSKRVQRSSARKTKVFPISSEKKAEKAGERMSSSPAIPAELAPMQTRSGTRHAQEPQNISKVTTRRSGKEENAVKQEQPVRRLTRGSLKKNDEETAHGTKKKEVARKTVKKAHEEVEKRQNEFEDEDDEYKSLFASSPSDDGDYRPEQEEVTNEQTEGDPLGSPRKAEGDDEEETDLEHSVTFCSPSRNDNRELACEKCDMTFPTYIFAINHVISAHMDGQYPCVKCPFVTKSEMDLKFHLRFHRLVSQLPRKDLLNALKQVQPILPKLIPGNDKELAKFNTIYAKKRAEEVVKELKNMPNKLTAKLTREAAAVGLTQQQLGLFW